MSNFLKVLCILDISFSKKISFYIPGWGLTETSPTVTMQMPEHWLTKAGCIGGLLANMEARIVLDDGTDAPEGDPGEIWIRGPNVMKVC